MWSNYVPWCMSNVHSNCSECSCHGELVAATPRCAHSQRRVLGAKLLATTSDDLRWAHGDDMDPYFTISGWPPDYKNKIPWLFPDFSLTFIKISRLFFRQFIFQNTSVSYFNGKKKIYVIFFLIINFLPGSRLNKEAIHFHQLRLEIWDHILN